MSPLFKYSIDKSPMTIWFISFRWKILLLVSLSCLYLTNFVFVNQTIETFRFLANCLYVFKFHHTKAERLINRLLCVLNHCTSPFIFTFFESLFNIFVKMSTSASLAYWLLFSCRLALLWLISGTLQYEGQRGVL